MILIRMRSEKQREEIIKNKRMLKGRKERIMED